MNFVLSFLILSLAAVFHITILSKIALFNVMPNLVLILVICWTYLRDIREGVIWALISGLILDLFSGAPFGTFVVGLIIVSILVDVLKRKILGETKIAMISNLALGTFIFDLIFLVTIKFSKYNIDFVNFIKYLLYLVIPEIIYNTILGVILFYFISKFSSWLLFYENQIKILKR